MPNEIAISSEEYHALANWLSWFAKICKGCGWPDDTCANLARAASVIEAVALLKDG